MHNERIYQKENLDIRSLEDDEYKKFLRVMVNYYVSDETGGYESDATVDLREGDVIELIGRFHQWLTQTPPL